MAKRYRVTLELAERDELEALLSHGKADVRRLNHARILLKADESQWGPACSDTEVAFPRSNESASGLSKRVGRWP